LAGLEGDTLAQQTLAIGNIAAIFANQSECMSRSGITGCFGENVTARSFRARQITLPYQVRYLRELRRTACK